MTKEKEEPASSQGGLQDKREEKKVLDETQSRLAPDVTPEEAATFSQEVKKIGELSPNILPKCLRDFTCWICSELNRPVK